jgi:glycosyltransferase involved in cell wall biosynthesis
MPEIAFFAPMKPPTHPTPSGDRAMARGLLQALGPQANLASDLRIYDGRGDLDTQNSLIEQASAEAEKLTEQGRRDGWKLWFTYHNYYKSPDLIGPIVAQNLNIPYIILEATRAKKRLHGPWAKFAKRAENACDAADVILYFTEQDKQALEAYRTPNQQIIHLPPFLTATETSPPRNKPQGNRLLAVGMMREGAKSASYAVIAETLHALKTPDWRMHIVGDGPARAKIETLFQPFGERIHFLGQKDKATLAAIYEASSVFFWPGVDEAFGMVYLEAQAAGLPVVAQDRPGLRDVIAPSTNLPAVDNIPDMAMTIDQLLNDAALWQNRSRAGLEHMAHHHLLGAARNTLMRVITPLTGSNP